MFSMAWQFAALLLGQSVNGVQSALSALHKNAGDSNIGLSMALHSNGNPVFSLTGSSSEEHATHHNHRLQHHHHTPLNSLPPTTTHAPTIETNHAGSLYLQLTEQQIASSISAHLCLGLDDIFIALFLVCFLNFN